MAENFTVDEVSGICIFNFDIFFFGCIEDEDGKYICYIIPMEHDHYVLDVKWVD